jgi:hypothetical protein
MNQPDGKQWPTSPWLGDSAAAQWALWRAECNWAAMNNWFLMTNPGAPSPNVGAPTPSPPSDRDSK